ncbi:TOMM precursor leader peptide-binding protein [Streptomyces sp. NPDC051776]|uniref:TOMM precursor leader peptide-binding protein n=1 Tax=Streptomyces sp. NPDC051776 TaxID=3155414 RepID=UPI0034421E6F
MPITTAPMHVLWTGEFGERVAGHVARMTGSPTQRAGLGDLQSATWPHTPMRLVATWRLEDALLNEVARLHHACRTPWLPIVHEFPVIRVGPLVVPHRGPCYGCYVRRRAQHDRPSASAAALRASLAADPAHGVSGFTDAQAGIAAGLALDLLDQWDSASGLRSGLVLFYDVLTRSLVADTVARVHGCPDCGTPPHPDDGWERLAADLLAGSAGGEHR